MATSVGKVLASLNARSTSLHQELPEHAFGKPVYDKTIYVLGGSRDRFQFWAEGAQRLANEPTETGRHRVVAIDHPDVLDALGDIWAKNHDGLLAVNDPYDADEVAQVIRKAEAIHGSAEAILTNFDPYVGTAARVDRQIVPFARQHRGHVMGSNKAEFREVMTRLGYGGLLARGIIVRSSDQLTEVNYPKGEDGGVVAKADVGAASLNMFVCRNLDEARSAINAALTTENFGGQPTKRVVVEELILGTEHSLQIVVRPPTGLDAKPAVEIVTATDKLTLNGTAKRNKGMTSSFEFGHVVRPGNELPNYANFQKVAEAVVHAMGARGGIVQLDVFRRKDGTVVAIDPGVRPSGANIPLAHTFMGLNVSGAALAAALGRTRVEVGKLNAYAARCILPNHAALATANELAAQNGPASVTVLSNPYADGQIKITPRTAPIVEHFGTSLATAIVAGSDLTEVRQTIGTIATASGLSLSDGSRNLATQ